MTVHVMERSMSEQELYNWSVYLKNEKPDVNELQMAVLANMISSYMGNKKSKFENFLIRKQNKETTNKPMSNSSILGAFQALAAK